MCPSGGEPDWGAVARHGPAIATLQAFGEDSGAERVAVLLDGEGEAGTLLEWVPGAPVEVTHGEEVYVVPGEATAAVAPLPLPVEVIRAPPGTAIELDLEGERVLAPVGVVSALADGVLGLARALGGRTVASADFATSDPDRPLTVAAREGEGVMLAMGDVQFEL